MSVVIDQEALLVEVGKLEPLPPTVTRLSQLVASGAWEASDVEEIVTFDQALTARVLAWANSAASASATEIVRVRDAVVRLGIGPILSLVTGYSVRHTAQPALPEYGLSEGQLWRHSVASALAVEVLAPVCTKRHPPESFAAALLHDIGKLIMARFLDSSQLVLIAETLDVRGQSSVEAEAEVLGVDHAEVGGLVARHWKLPHRIVAGIAQHHDPDSGDDIVCDVVHVANILAKRIGTGHSEVPRDADLHPPCLGRLGLTAEAFEGSQEKLSDRLAAVESQYG